VHPAPEATRRTTKRAAKQMPISKLNDFAQIFSLNYAGKLRLFVFSKFQVRYHCYGIFKKIFLAIINTGSSD
jgi:hypothetical protein